MCQWLVVAAGALWQRHSRPISPDPKPRHPIDAFQNRKLTPDGAAKKGCGESVKLGPIIKAVSDPAKKQQAQALARGAFADLKSGGYQNCLDKLRRIKALIMDNFVAFCGAAPAFGCMHAEFPPQ